MPSPKLLTTALVAVTLSLMTACSVPPPSPSVPLSSVPPASVRPPPGPTAAAVTLEVERLRTAFAEQVPGQPPVTEEDDRAWMVAAMAVMVEAGVKLDRPQLVVVVDRDPLVQALRVMLAEPAAPWRGIGGGKVSTGQCARPGYFITPVGVFHHTDAIVGYRAQGTPNESGIRGLGIKGMRVWDFGWQSAEPGWGTDREPREIRLQLHATDPAHLEQRLGRPASKGCIRVSTAMNRFLDLHGVLDADYEQSARTDARIAALLHPRRTPSPLAGNMLIVVDTPQSDPAVSRAPAVPAPPAPRPTANSPAAPSAV